jgi:hypothetical protein
MSALAEKIAPPSDAGVKSIRERGGKALMFLGGFVILAAIMQPFSDKNHYDSIVERFGVSAFVIVILLALGAGTFWAGRKLRDIGAKPRLAREVEYRRALDEWQRSWVCNRCGNIFVGE